MKQTNTNQTNSSITRRKSIALLGGGVAGAAGAVYAIDKVLSTNTTDKQSAQTATTDNLGSNTINKSTKVLLINGSPRKEGNTATLLKKAQEGAASMGMQTELIHLYDLNYKGCISCFHCKRKDIKYTGKCAKQDDLSAVLDKAMESKTVIMGSPIYLNDVTGEMRSFLERFCFMNLAYSKKRSNFEGRIDLGFIYTMNVSEEMGKDRYAPLFEAMNFGKRTFHGKWEEVFAFDTYQFDDYSKYITDMFDEKHKREVREKQFPIDCQNAFNLGKMLVE